MRVHYRNIFFAILLFVLFFLPGYLSQSAAAEIPIVLDESYLTLSTLWYFPVILILTALIIHAPEDGRRRCGWRRPSAADLVLVPLLTAVTLFISFLFAPSSLRFRVELDINGFTGIAFILFNTLILAAAEELFFRSWLLGIFAGKRRSLAAALSTFLFACGHLWQGVMGMLIAVLIGLVYAAWLLRRQSIVPIIIAHWLHNTLVIFLMTQYSL